MISTVTGVLNAITETAVHVAPVPSIALEIAVPAHLLADLTPRTGETVTLHTKLTLDSTTQGASFTPRLVGFASENDRAFFDLLTSVRGFGARKALRALTKPPAEVASAIAAADTAALTALPEIGKKMAQTIINEIAEPAARFADTLPRAAGHAAVASRAAPSHPTVADAVAALVALGHTPPDAERSVRAALGEADPATLSASELVERAFAGA